MVCRAHLAHAGHSHHIKVPSCHRQSPFRCVCSRVHRFWDQDEDIFTGRHSAAHAGSLSLSCGAFVQENFGSIVSCCGWSRRDWPRAPVLRAEASLLQRLLHPCRLLLSCPRPGADLGGHGGRGPGSTGEAGFLPPRTVLLQST